MAPTGSSIFILSMPETEKTTNNPATKPIITEFNGDIISAPAVIPTNPANEPLSVIERSGLLKSTN